MIGSLCYNGHRYEVKRQEVRRVDKRLEEWFRKPVESLSPNSMGLPVVVRSEKDPERSSPLAFLGVEKSGAKENPALHTAILDESPKPDLIDDVVDDSFVDDVLLGSLESGPSEAVNDEVETLAPLPEVDQVDLNIEDEPNRAPTEVFEDTLSTEEHREPEAPVSSEGEGGDLGGSFESLRDQGPLSDSPSREDEDSVLFGDLKNDGNSAEPDLDHKVPESKPFVDGLKVLRNKRLVVYAATVAFLTVSIGSFFFVGGSGEKKLREANEMFLRGDMEKALELFESSEKKVALDGTSLVRKGDILALQGREAEALNSYYGALAITPDSSEIHRKVADTFLALGSTNQAEKAYLEVLRLMPADYGVRALISRLRLEKGDMDGALDLLENLPPEESSDEIDSLRLEILAQLPIVEVSLDWAQVTASTDLVISEDDQVKVAEVPVVEVPVEVVSPPVVPAKPSASTPKKTAKQVERASVPPPVEVKKTETPRGSAEVAKLSRILTSGRNIDVQDGPVIKKIAEEDGTGATLYSLGRMFNQAGRPREAMVFLEKALVKDGKNRWILAEAAYSSASVGRKDEALAMIEQALIKGNKTFPDGDPPSILAPVTPSVWDIGWEKGNGVADGVPLYRSEAAIPGLSRPRIDSDRYVFLQEAIRINPQDRSLYVGLMALYNQKGTLLSSNQFRALAMGIEAHACFSKGHLERGNALLMQAINLAPDMPFLIELKRMSEKNTLT